jgi:hypothetical protein
VAAALDRLRSAPLNHDPAGTGGPGWHRDEFRQPLPSERPGEPEPAGPWAVARELSRDYAFADPALVRGHFDRRRPLDGREMLLVLRVLGVGIDAGVRVCSVRDGSFPREGRPARLFAWAYRTLDGHVEAGRRDFEVWKLLDTGEVEFVTRSVSRVAGRNPLVHVGFRMLGRHKRAEFGERACARMASLTAAAARAAGAAASAG